MIRNILTAETFASTPAELQKRHERAVAKLRANGIAAEIATISQPQFPYINEGRWLIDCACGSGVLVHPEWRLGRCFGCGALYSNVEFPLDREALEAVLVDRTKLSTRNWAPGETVEQLRQENLDHGIRGTK